MEGEGLWRRGGRMGLRWRGGRGGALVALYTLPCFLLSVNRRVGVSGVILTISLTFHLLPLLSCLFLLLLWLQDATQDRCPQIVPTPGPNSYSLPVHVNMTSHIDVHVTFADNTVPVSHTSRSTNCC